MGLARKIQNMIPPSQKKKRKEKKKENEFSNLYNAATSCIKLETS